MERSRWVFPAGWVSPVSFVNGQLVQAADLNNFSVTTVTTSGAVSVGTTLSVTGATSPLALLDISGASAGQIKFPATQNASSNANTLDDYEEGTWVPSIGGTATYTNQVGTYTKVGRQVHVQGRLTINAIGSGDTGIISGLPFSAASVMAGTVGLFTGSATNYSFVTCCVNTTTVVLIAIGAAGANMTNPAVFFQNGSDIFFAVSYHV